MDKTYSYIDSSNIKHDIVLEKDSFTLQQRDKKIMDKSFSSKPTTFLKDAFKRFAKSKAAIISTVILGIIILLSIIIPIALPYDTTGKTTLGAQYLPPKITEAGTGFWDGTKKYKDMVYNPETKMPDGNFDSTAILEGSLSAYDGFVDNSPNKFATGGYIRISSIGNDEYIYSSKNVSISADKKLTLQYQMEENITPDNIPLPYYISLYKEDTEILLHESSSFGSFSLDVSDKIQGKTEEELSSLFLKVGYKGSNKDEKNGIFLKEIKISSDDQLLDNISFTDANKALLDEHMRTNSANLSGLSQAVIKLCSFTYDPYKVAYGEIKYIYSKDDIQKFIDKGDIKYDFDVGPSSLVILNDLCPIIKIESQNITSAAGITVSEIVTIVSKYKQLGFKEMPKHLFGTNRDGIDMLKYVFEGTRNSLFLAIIIAAICFLFGLLFGSIEGYFGGAIDLFLERFVEILSNIPSIILITICVLNLGQNFSVFILAMCLTGWIGTAGITRTQFYRFKKREYVLASKSLGASDARLIFHHILPNSLGTIITSSVLMIPSVIYTEATLSYLGIGLAGQSSLGNILSTNQVNIASNQYLLIFPAALLAIMLICFNLFGNGLRDAMNPTFKGSS